MKPRIKTTYLQIRTEPAFMERLRAASAAERRSMSEMARYAVHVYLAKHYPETQVTTTPEEMAKAGRKQARRASAVQE